MLKSILKILGLIILLYVGLAQASGQFIFNEKQLPNHPRLLLSKNGEGKVLASIHSDSTMSLVNKSIIEQCNSFIKQPPLEYKLTGIRLLGVSMSAIKRIFYLSYAYRITNNHKYAQRAREELLNVCNFKDWNPKHFLDVAEMSMAIGIGYDWIYDCLSETDKATIVKALKEKAFLPAFDKRNGYVFRRTNNWNPICFGGLLYAALAIAEEEPEIVSELMTRLLSGNPKALNTYSPDGGYPEGYGYWNYGTMYQVLIIDALQSVFGDDYKLSEAKGFMSTPYFMLFMTAPSGKCFNFGDNEENVNINIPLWWFASKDNNPVFIYNDYNLISKNQYSKDRFLPLIPIWFSLLENTESKTPKGNFWINHGEPSLYIYREGWTRNDDTYLAVKGGKASTPHAHMDAGSFVYEYDGVRWASDLGLQNYNSLESKGVKIWDNSQDGQRWDVMRMRNDCHNTLTIDSGRHLVAGNAPIIHTFTDKIHKGAVVDLSSILDNVTSVHREVSLDVNDHLSVIDTVITDNKGINLTWVMVTPADSKIIDDKTIALSKDNKTMILSIETTGNVEPQIWSNHPIHDYDAPNNGSMRVGFSSNLTPDTSYIFKVTLKPQSAEM